MKPNTLRETDDQAIALARRLVREASYAALGVNESGTGFPLVSRVLMATDLDGAPVILVSRLSFHTQAIEHDSRVSLLTGEPGKGDPLAHPRLTTRCHVRPILRDGKHHGWLKERFLARHPKAKTYVDFPDFAFMRLEPVSANLNGGFGKAYVLEGDSIVRPNALESYQWFDRTYALQRVAATLSESNKNGISLVDIDPEGFYKQKNGVCLRVEFSGIANSNDDLTELIKGTV